jgi:hypothetical protein
MITVVLSLMGVVILVGVYGWISINRQMKKMIDDIDF